jgi:transaldolase
MGASFRSKDEILGLAGIDSLTISPKLLDELEKCSDDLERVLDASSVESNIERVHVTESMYRWSLNEDQMATDKLSEGIRNFNKDLEKLRDTVKTKLGGEH